MKNRTLAIIKPDVVNDNYIGEIISLICKAGFKVKALKMVKLSEDAAKAFYEIHKEKPFYNDLVKYMTSGPCVPIALEKENAVEDYRKLIGSTDPAQAEQDTVRKLYARSKQLNAVHGSDSDENAAKEIAFFFGSKELIENYPE